MERPLPRKAVRIPKPFSDGLFRYADTFVRGADEDFFFQPRACLIVCRQMLFDGFDQVVRQQGDDAAAEAAAGHAYAALFADDFVYQFHQRVDGGVGDFEAVAHTRVAFGHQAGEGGDVVAAECFGGIQRAAVFFDDVAGAAGGGFVQTCFAGLELFQGQVSQGFDAEVGGGGFALAAAGVVFAADQAALHVGMDNHDAERVGDGDGRGVQAAAVDEQGVAALSARAGELVHDAALAADEAVFGVLADFGQHGFVGRQVEGRLKHLGDGNFQCGGRTQARALRHVAADGDVEAV